MSRICRRFVVLGGCAFYFWRVELLFWSVLAQHGYRIKYVIEDLPVCRGEVFCTAGAVCALLSLTWLSTRGRTRSAPVEPTMWRGRINKPSDFGKGCFASLGEAVADVDDASVMTGAFADAIVFHLS